MRHRSLTNVSRKCENFCRCSPWRPSAPRLFGQFHSEPHGKEAKPMRSKDQFRNLLFHTISRAATAALALAIMLVAAVLATGSAQAQTYTESVLYSFQGGTDGAGPYAGLV